MTLRDKAAAQAAERQAAMPSPVTAARRGIIVGRYMGLSEQQSALMVMTAASAAISSARLDGATDVAWLDDIHEEAARAYMRQVQATLPGGTPWDVNGRLRDLACPECGKSWSDPSPGCPRKIYNLHKLTAP